MLYVCSLREMPLHAEALRPEALVSLVPADLQPPRPAGIAAGRHLRLSVDDVDAPGPGMVAPAREHVEELVAFVERLDAEASVLLHCQAGISRSTAAALVAMVLEGAGHEHEAAAHLRRAAPHAVPNRRIVALADEVLGRGGRLLAARDAMEPPHLLLEAPLVELPRRLPAAGRRARPAHTPS